MHPPSESTSQFIRKYLSEEGKGYPWKMYKEWCSHLERLDFKAPKFESFRKYIWVLTKLGLIRRTTAPAYKQLSPIPRVYYELILMRINTDKVWANPQAALFGNKMRLGRRRYRRKISGIPAMSVGRPKKLKTAAQQF